VRRGLATSLAAGSSAAVCRSLPDVVMRAVASDELEATGVTAENSLHVDAAAREVVKQANYRRHLDEINRRHQPVA